MNFDEAMKCIEVIPLKFTEVTRNWWAADDMLGGRYEAIFDGQNWAASWKPRSEAIASGGPWEALPDCLRFLQGVHREKVLGQLTRKAGA